MGEIEGGGIGDAALERKRLGDLGPIREYDGPSMFANDDDGDDGGMNVPESAFTYDSDSTDEGGGAGGSQKGRRGGRGGGTPARRGWRRGSFRSLSCTILRPSFRIRPDGPGSLTSARGTASRGEEGLPNHPRRRTTWRR